MNAKIEGGQIHALGKQKKEGSQIQSKNLIKVVTLKMCLLSLHFVKYMIFIISNALMSKFESPPKIGGGQRKLRGRRS